MNEKRPVSWKVLISHLGALALGFVLGYQIPGVMTRYRLSKEIDQMQLQIKQDPSSSDNWSSMGFLKWRASDNRGAVAAYQKALELDSLNVAAYLGLGNLYFKDGTLGAAEKSFADALRIAQQTNNLSDTYMAQQLLKFVRAREAGQDKKEK